LGFGVHARGDLAGAVELSMVAVIGVSARREFEIIRMVLLCHYFVLFRLFFILFIVDFGFGVDELIGSVALEALARTFSIFILLLILLVVIQILALAISIFVVGFAFFFLAILGFFSLIIRASCRSLYFAISLLVAGVPLDVSALGTVVASFASLII
jgi:hypothetical protein